MEASENTERLPNDPTQEEIAECCRKFQAGWTVAERRRRERGVVVETVAWVVPELADPLPASEHGEMFVPLGGLV